MFFFFKQKTAYEMRISDWSSDVCSSDLSDRAGADAREPEGPERHRPGHGGGAADHLLRRGSRLHGADAGGGEGRPQRRRRAADPADLHDRGAFDRPTGTSTAVGDAAQHRPAAAAAAGLPPVTPGANTASATS